jgi:hypothetical protein
VRDAFHEFGHVVAELLKLAALFVFVLSPRLLVDIGVNGWPLRCSPSSPPGS